MIRNLASAILFALCLAPMSASGAQSAGRSDHASPENAAGSNNVIEELARLDLALEEARRVQDGPAFIDALAAIVALEAHVRTPFSHSAALTRPSDFKEAAAFARGDDALARKLLSLTPVRYRGEVEQEGVIIPPGATITYSIGFPPNDWAGVMPRGGDHGAVELAVRDPKMGALTCRSLVQAGDPICIWRTGQTAAYEIEITNVSVTKQSVQIIYSK